jgi:hypothetical protein
LSVVVLVQLVVMWVKEREVQALQVALLHLDPMHQQLVDPHLLWVLHQDQL